MNTVDQLIKATEDITEILKVTLNKVIELEKKLDVVHVRLAQLEMQEKIKQSLGVL